MGNIEYGDDCLQSSYEHFALVEYYGSNYGSGGVEILNGHNMAHETKYS